MNRVNFLVRRLPVVRNNVRRFTTIDKTEMQNMITKSQVFVFDVRWGFSSFIARDSSLEYWKLVLGRVSYGLGWNEINLERLHVGL